MSPSRALSLSTASHVPVKARARPALGRASGAVPAEPAQHSWPGPARTASRGLACSLLRGRLRDAGRLRGRLRDAGLLRGRLRDAGRLRACVSALLGGWACGAVCRSWRRIR